MVVNVPDEIEDALAEAAQRFGVTPESFVVDTLRARLAEVAQELPIDEWEARLRGIAVYAGVSLSDEATSRDSLYD